MLRIFCKLEKIIFYLSW